MRHSHTFLIVELYLTVLSCLQCVYLDERHPLKVLSALQLSVLERESQGLLPNRRRARYGRIVPTHTRAQS